MEQESASNFNKNTHQAPKTMGLVSANRRHILTVWTTSKKDLL